MVKNALINISSFYESAFSAVRSSAAVSPRDRRYLRGCEEHLFRWTRFFSRIEHARCHFSFITSASGFRKIHRENAEAGVLSTQSEIYSHQNVGSRSLFCGIISPHTLRLESARIFRSRTTDAKFPLHARLETASCTRFFFRSIRLVKTLGVPRTNEKNI